MPGTLGNSNANVHPKGIAAAIPFAVDTNQETSYAETMLSIRKTILLLIISFSLSFSACQQPTSSASPSIHSLIIPDYQSLSQHNLITAATTTSSWLSELIFDGLVKLDDRLQVQPNLASSWEVSKDGHTWTFHLRRGVKFHDGIELTAKDVKYTLDGLRRTGIKTLYSYNLNEIDKITIKDPYTIEIRLKNIVAPFLSDLTMGILPQHLSNATNIADSDSNFHPVGTGPFKVMVASETESVLQANENYFLGRPILDRLKVKVYPSQEAAWSDLLRGGSDFFWHLNSIDFQRLQQIPAFHQYSAMKPYYYLLALNMENALFHNRMIRQALNYAIDKEAIVKSALEGYGQISAGTIYPGSWAHNSELKAYPYDPQRALALLGKAGWRDHDGDHFLDKDSRQFEFTVYSNSGDDLKQRVLLLIQQQLLDVGIKMNVALFDAADTDFLFQKRFEAHFPEIDAGGDPNLNYRYWHSSQIHGGFNVGSYRNIKVDQLLDEGRYTFDTAKRKVIYDTFQQELFNDPPGIFLFWTDYLVGVNERFKGVKIGPAGPFANIREWYVDEGQHAGS